MRRQRKRKMRGGCGCNSSGQPPMHTYYGRNTEFAPAPVPSMRGGNALLDSFSDIRNAYANVNLLSNSSSEQSYVQPTLNRFGAHNQPEA